MCLSWGVCVSCLHSKAVRVKSAVLMFFVSVTKTIALALTLAAAAATQ